MAIKKNKIDATNINFAKTQVLIGVTKKNNLKARVRDADFEAKEVREQQRKNREFYRQMLERDESKFENYIETDYKFQEFESSLSGIIKDLYFDIKKYVTSKFLEYVERGRLSINNVKAFHFLVLNNENFVSWFENISSFNLIERSIELFSDFLDKASTQRGFDVTDLWVSDAEKAFREFLITQYLPKVREIYARDWIRARKNYLVSLKRRDFDQFKFEDK